MAMVAASKNGKGDGKGSNAIGMNRTWYDTGNYSALCYDKEAYGFQQDITVASGTTINSQITLPRIVGMLCIQISGEIPDVIKRVHIEHRYEPEMNLSSGETIELSVSKSVSKDLTITDTNTLEEYSRYMFADDMTVYIITYDEENNQVSRMDIPVKVYKNRRTIIKGDSKTLLNETPFEVSIEDAWGNDNIIPL